MAKLLDRKSYEQNPALWFAKSEGLGFAATATQEAADRAHAEYEALAGPFHAYQAEKYGQILARSYQTEEERERADEVNLAYHRWIHALAIGAMLRALCIEAELKGGTYARLLRDRKLAGAEADLPPFNPKRSHNAAHLAADLGIPLNPEEKALIRRLELLRQLGPYPLATTISGWQTNFGSSPKAENALLEKVRTYCRGLWQEVKPLVSSLPVGG
jgi:hypothetical protein